MFSFLGASYGNYIEPIDYTKGFPEDASSELKEIRKQFGENAWGDSYINVGKLLDFDYTEHVYESPHGSEARIPPYVSELGGVYFNELWKIAKLGKPYKTRIVFWFDN